MAPLRLALLLLAALPAQAHDLDGAAGLAPGGGEWNGTTYRTILPAEDTGGALSVMEMLAPEGSGPPRHVHAEEDETFIVLAGRYRFWVDGETFERGPGEAAFVPRGSDHTFRVMDGAPGHHIVVLNPGGAEAFFGEMIAGGYRVPQEMEAIGRSAADHALTFTGPPLGPDE